MTVIRLFSSFIFYLAGQEGAWDYGCEVLISILCMLCADLLFRSSWHPPAFPKMQTDFEIVIMWLVQRNDTLVMPSPATPKSSLREV